MLFGNEINGTGGGHAAGKTVDALLLEVGDQVRVVGDYGEGVAGRDEGVGTVDHVTVAVAVGGGAKVYIVFVDSFNEGVGVNEIWVWVPTTEVGGGLAVLSAAAGKAEFFFENSNAIGAGDAVEAVKEHFEVVMAGEKLFDQGEVEDVLEHGDVVSCGVDYLNIQASVASEANGVDVYLLNLSNFVGCESLRGSKNLVCDGFWGWSSICEIIFDTKISVWSC